MATETQEFCSQCLKKPIYIKGRKLCRACYRKMYYNGTLRECGTLQTHFIRIITDAERLVQEIDERIKNNRYIKSPDRESANILLQTAKYCLFLHNHPMAANSPGYKLPILNVILDSTKK